MEENEPNWTSEEMQAIWDRICRGELTPEEAAMQERYNKVKDIATENVLANLDVLLRKFIFSFDLKQVTGQLGFIGEHDTTELPLVTYKNGDNRLSITYGNFQGTPSYRFAVAIMDPATGKYPKTSLQFNANLVLDGLEGKVIIHLDGPLNSGIVDPRKLKMGPYIARLEKS